MTQARITITLRYGDKQLRAVERIKDTKGLNEMRAFMRRVPAHGEVIKFMKGIKKI